jgi:hypothetical protein
LYGARFAGEVTLSLAFWYGFSGVLTENLYKSAEGNKVERVTRLAFFPREETGWKPEPELINANAEQLRNAKVPGFMDQNKLRQNDEKQQDGH